MPLISIIPEEYKEGFKKIALLNDGEFAQIENALQKLPSNSSTSDLIRLVSSLEIISRDDLAEILTTIESLVILFEDKEEVEEIINDIVILSIEAKTISSSEKDNFRKRLQTLLNNKQVYRASKAVDLVSEATNIFISGRIISDFRPIFELDLAEQPSTGIIVHNLHIHYQSEVVGSHKDLYLSLNSDDIQSLINVLLKAQDKEESLGILFEKIGISKINE